MRYLYNKRTILIVVLMIFCTAIVWAQQSETKRQYTSVTPNYTLTFPKILAPTQIFASNGGM